MPSMLSWINLADSAASVTATLEAVGLGVRNLLTEPVAEVWRVPTLSTSSATHLEITLAAPATIGVIALFAPRDGYLPPAYTVEVIGSTVALGASEAIYVPPAAMNLAANRGAWWHWPAAPVTLRYLRLKVVSGAGDQYLQLGRLWLGPDFRPAIQASRAGQARGVGTAGTTERAAVSGIVTAQRGATFRASRFALPLLTPAEAVQIETMALAVGTHGQVIANPRTAEGAASLVLGRFAAPPEAEIAAPRRWRAAMTVMEEL